MCCVLCCPSPGHECREDDGPLRELLSCIDDRDTRIAATVERAFLSELDGSCRMPIAALALVQNDLVSLRGLIARPDGSELLEVQQSAKCYDGERLGIELARQLLDRAKPGFFDD